MASETGLRSGAETGRRRSRPLSGSRAEPDRVEPGEEGRRSGPLYLSELVVGALVVAVVLVAWAALGLAHLGWYSLPAALGLAGGAFVAVAVAVRRFAPVRVATDPAGLVGAVLLAALAAVMFLPGFAYGVTDKDPGGYIQHAFSISERGTYRIVDPALDGRVPGGVELEDPGARFRSLWLQEPGSDVIVPQFYHLWPALLAVAHDVGGERGMVQTGPLLGVLAVLVAALALRRAVEAAPWAMSPRRGAQAGLVAGGIGGVLLSTNMLEVWQAKYPTTEISAQLFFLAALFGLVVALRTGWGPAAGAAGLVTGVGFLSRADALLPLLIAAALGAALVATRRWDARATWFAGGVLVVLPHALWQAYSPDAGLRYSEDNGLPSLAEVALVVLALAALAVVLRPIGPSVARWWSGRSGQLITGTAITAGAAVLLLLGFLRPRLFGEDFQDYEGQIARSYDEQILARLSWFLTRPVFLLVLLAVAVIALRRWSAPLWSLAAPLLLIFPIYGLHARNSTRLMWWSRRYVPNVLPLVLMLAAVALAAAVFLLAAEVARRRTRLAGTARVGTALAVAVAVAVLTGTYVRQSWPLRSHSEFGGSFDISKRIAAVAGDQQGVFLWQRSPACCLYAQSLFAGALWLERDQISAMLPREPDRVAGYIKNVRTGFPGQPVFLVWHSQAPPQLPGVRLEPVERVQTGLSYWEETFERRPTKATTVPVDFVVYRVTS